MEEFLQQWSYLGVFLTIIATGAGLPLPEELPVVIGGAIVGSGNAYWWLMLPVTIVAVILGDGVLYTIGRVWGPTLVERPFIKKHSLPPERLLKIEDNFQKYGIRILLFARLTPGIRAPTRRSSSTRTRSHATPTRTRSGARATRTSRTRSGSR